MSVICGPIVRKVDHQQASVFLVVDKGEVETAELNLFRDADRIGACGQATGFRSIRLGERCCALLLLSDIFDAGDVETFYYDVFIDGEGLGDDGTMSSVCFPGEALPSFYRPPVHRHYIQGSCRKPHTSGRKDQIVAGAEQLEQHLGSDERPSQLFLTGDQIYADDVAPPFLCWAEKVRDFLGLYQHEIIDNKGKKVRMDRRKLDKRNALLNNKSGITSGHCRSHLLSLHEYIAMYMLAFGGEDYFSRQGVTFPEYADIRKRFRFRRKPNNKGNHYYYQSNDFDGDMASLSAFIEGSNAGARKLLANIQTYMIFDDHEITDDWNLTDEHQRLLRETPLGRRVQVNGLASYFIFQHLGNCPEDISLLEPVSQYVKGDLDDDDASLTSMFERDWGYLLEQSPPVAVIDTRTSRRFTKGNRTSLMSYERMTQLGDAMAALPASLSAVLVSPAPVIGFDKIENIQSIWGAIFHNVLDAEAWCLNHDAVKKLLSEISRLNGIRNLLIFSGDVHYSFARYQEFSATNGDAPMDIYQLCCSPLCNAPMGSNAGLRVLETLGRDIGDEGATYFKAYKEDGETTFFANTYCSIASVYLTNNMHPDRFKLYGFHDNHEHISSYNLVSLDDGNFVP